MYGYVGVCKAMESTVYHILTNGETLYDAYTTYLQNSSYPFPVCHLWDHRQDWWRYPNHHLFAMTRISPEGKPKVKANLIIRQKKTPKSAERGHFLTQYDRDGFEIPRFQNVQLPVTVGGRYKRLKKEKKWGFTPYADPKTKERGQGRGSTQKFKVGKYSSHPTASCFWCPLQVSLILPRPYTPPSHTQPTWKKSPCLFHLMQAWKQRKAISLVLESLTLKLHSHKSKMHWRSQMSIQ